MQEPSKILALWAIVAASSVAGCEDSAPAGSAPVVTESSRARLNWKRSAALEQDLATALDLSADEVCTGPEGKRCATELYLVPLGGNDPIDSTMLEAVADPLITTPLAVDRLIFSACSTRVSLDAAASKPKVFEALDLRGAAPHPGSAAVSDTVTALYRRFHGRDADLREVERIGRLAQTEQGTAVDATEFALLACYSIGSTSEFLFF